jgi:tetratricopeptide (TPR) repeat protein
MPSATTITEVLKSHGYKTGAFVGAIVLDKKYGLAQGFDTYDDRVPEPMQISSSIFRDRRANEVTDSALLWLENLEEPFFMWVHYFDPHQPYDPPEQFLDKGNNLYDGEVEYVDSEVGRLLDAVSEKGLEGRTLVALTSDHGESLGEHGELTHSIFLYNATARVPLIITLPDVIPSGVSDSSIVELVDVMPTLLSVLDIELPVENEGRNLLDNSLPHESSMQRIAYSETWAPRLQFGWSEVKSLRNDRFLFVKSPRPEFYDLTEDPGELINIYDKNLDDIKHFEAVMDSIEASGEREEMSEEIEIGKEEREALEGLGYVLTSNLSDEPGKDPKDMIGVHRDILKGWRLLNEMNFEEAFEVLKTVIAQDESDPQVYLALGLCYEGLGEYDQSLSHLRRAIELDPLEERSYYAASIVLGKTGRLEESAEILQSLVTVYDDDPAAWLMLAKARMRSGDGEKAFKAYLKSIDLDRGYYRAYLDFGKFLATRGRFAMAIEELGKAIHLKPDCAPAHALIGASLAKTGELEEAAESFRTSLEIDHTKPSVWVDLGKVQSELGDVVRARRSFENALKLDPDYEPAKSAIEGLNGQGGED